MGFRFNASVDSKELRATPEKYCDNVDGAAFWTLKGAERILTDTTLKKVKWLFQPLNYLLFDSTGAWVGSVANCDSKGSIMRSNWAELLDTFPIQSWPTDSSITFFKLQGYLSGDSMVLGGRRFTAVVFWSKKFGRHNKKFLKQVGHHLNQYSSSVNKVYFVNFDYLLEDVEMDVNL